DMLQPPILLRRIRYFLGNGFRDNVTVMIESAAAAARGAVTALWFAVLVWAETLRPLRPMVEPKLRRLLRNLVFAGISAAAVRGIELPVVLPLAASAQERSWGLLHQITLPPWLELTLALVLLDYTLYIWHVLTHRVPLLWRFHAVHHLDLDLDA